MELTENCKKYLEFDSKLWNSDLTEKEHLQLLKERRTYELEKFTLLDYDSMICHVRERKYPPAIKGWERSRAKYLAAHPTSEQRLTAMKKSMGFKD